MGLTPRYIWIRLQIKFANILKLVSLSKKLICGAAIGYLLPKDPSIPYIVCNLFLFMATK